MGRMGVKCKGSAKGVKIIMKLNIALYMVIKSLLKLETRHYKKGNYEKQRKARVARHYLTDMLKNNNEK